MPTERLPLPDSGWIDLVTRANHAQARRYREAIRDDKDRVTEMIASRAANWSIRDADGVDIPFPGAAPEGVPSESLDRIPADVIDVIATRIAELLTGAPDPNGSAATSGDSP